MEEQLGDDEYPETLQRVQYNIQNNRITAQRQTDFMNLGMAVGFNKSETVAFSNAFFLPNPLAIPITEATMRWTMLGRLKAKRKWSYDDINRVNSMRLDPRYALLEELLGEHPCWEDALNKSHYSSKQFTNKTPANKIPTIIHINRFQSYQTRPTHSTHQTCPIHSTHPTHHNSNSNSNNSNNNNSPQIKEPRISVIDEDEIIFGKTLGSNKLLIEDVDFEEDEDVLKQAFGEIEKLEEEGEDEVEKDKEILDEIFGNKSSNELYIIIDISTQNIVAHSNNKENIMDIYYNRYIMRSKDQTIEKILGKSEMDKSDVKKNFQKLYMIIGRYIICGYDKDNNEPINIF